MDVLAELDLNVVHGIDADGRFPGHTIPRVALARSKDGGENVRAGFDSHAGCEGLAGLGHPGGLDEVVIVASDLALQRDLGVAVVIRVRDARSGQTRNVTLLLLAREVRLFLDGYEVRKVSHVEPVDVLDDKVVPVLDVDADEGLFGEGVLGVLHVVQVAGRDGWDVVAVVADVGERRANVEYVRLAPRVVTLRADERVRARFFVIRSDTGNLKKKKITSRSIHQLVKNELKN